MADGTVLEIKVDTDEVCLVGHSLLSIQVDDEIGDQDVVISFSS